MRAESDRECIKIDRNPLYALFRSPQLGLAAQMMRTYEPPSRLVSGHLLDLLGADRVAEDLSQALFQHLVASAANSGDRRPALHVRDDPDALRRPSVRIEDANAADHGSMPAGQSE